MARQRQTIEQVNARIDEAFALKGAEPVWRVMAMGKNIGSKDWTIENTKTGEVIRWFNIIPLLHGRQPNIKTNEKRNMETKEASERVNQVVITKHEIKTGKFITIKLNPENVDGEIVSVKEIENWDDALRYKNDVRVELRRMLGYCKKEVIRYAAGYDNFKMPKRNFHYENNLTQLLGMLHG